MRQCRLQNLDTAMHKSTRRKCRWMWLECRWMWCGMHLATALTMRWSRRSEHDKQLTCPQSILRAGERDKHRICTHFQIGCLRGFIFRGQSQTHVSLVAKPSTLRDVKMLCRLAMSYGMLNAVFFLSLHYFSRAVAKAHAVAKTVASESMVAIAIAIFHVGGRQPRRQARVLRRWGQAECTLCQRATWRGRRRATCRVASRSVLTRDARCRRVAPGAHAVATAPTDTRELAMRGRQLLCMSDTLTGDN